MFFENKIICSSLNTAYNYKKFITKKDYIMIPIGGLAHGYKTVQELSYTGAIPKNGKSTHTDIQQWSISSDRHTKLHSDKGIEITIYYSIFQNFKTKFVSIFVSLRGLLVLPAICWGKISPF